MAAAVAAAAARKLRRKQISGRLMTVFISKPKMAELWFGRFEYYPCIQKWQYIQGMLMCDVGEKPVAYLMKFICYNGNLQKEILNEF